MKYLEELRFLYFCFQKRDDVRFRKNVYEIMDDVSLVHLLKMGEENNHPNYYLIEPDASGSGFFADHRKLLGYLYFADYYGLCPVVKYGKGYSYAEREPVNGTDNPFEYYFKQPAGVSLSDISVAKRVLKSRKENAFLVSQKYSIDKGYEFSEDYLAELGRVSAKYICLNDDTESWMQEQMKEVLGGKKTLGVHVRGTDFKRNYMGHPVKVETEEYIEATWRLLEKADYDRIFLATDDSGAVRNFQMQFGNRVVFYQDVVRSDGNETVMKSNSERKYHHYLLGREVLRDAWTLGHCDGLVAGLSQVSMNARILKKAGGADYLDVVILDKGMNRKGDFCKPYMKEI